tara:strand:+ start:429 stop:734 length:306 start_codon:yes stop_codon:yes gene_type:complete
LINKLNNKYSSNQKQMNIKEVLKPLGIFVTSIFVLSTISWLLANVYVWICAPFTFWGWLSAPLSLGSPICQFINFSQYEIGKYYIAFWLSAGISLLTCFKK